MKCLSSYEGYVIDGFRFYIKKHQWKRETQNSGVVVEGKLKEVRRTSMVCLKRRFCSNMMPLKIEQVLGWHYSNVNGLMFTMSRKIKRNKFGATLVNVTRRLQTNEPFVLAY